MIHCFLFMFAIVLLCRISAKAQTPVALMPIPHPQFFGQGGLPLAGCKIFTYISGTSTPQGTFFDSGGTIPNPNPVTCDAGGFVSIYLISGDTYRILVQDQFGVQQYLVDGVVGIGSGALSIFSQNNTWTGINTFNGAVNLNVGGALGGIFTGNPTFSGMPNFSGNPSFTGLPSFTNFTISSSSVIANLDAQFWNGVQGNGVPTSGQVPVATSGTSATWNNLQSIAGVATTSQLPGSGATTINGTSCTIGSSCTVPTGVIFSTISSATTGNLGPITMATPAANSDWRATFYVEITAAGIGCNTLSQVAITMTWTDPLAAGSTTFGNGTSQGILVNLSPTGNGNPGPASSFMTGLGTSTGTATMLAPALMFRAKSGTTISYSTSALPSAGCTTNIMYQVVPVLEQMTTN